MTYVTDTHPLLWHLAALGRNAEAAFDEADSGHATMVVPAIVLAETIVWWRKSAFYWNFRRYCAASDPPQTIACSLSI
jgi:hypothetical protein